MLEDALRSLDRVNVIGLTERFDESLVPGDKDAGVAANALPGRENVTPDRKPREAIAPEVIDLVKRYNTLDLALYESASKRFELPSMRRATDSRSRSPLSSARTSARGERHRGCSTRSAPLDRGAERRSDGRSRPARTAGRSPGAAAPARCRGRVPHFRLDASGQRGARHASASGTSPATRRKALSRRRPVVRAFGSTRSGRRSARPRRGRRYRRGQDRSTAPHRGQRAESARRLERRSAKLRTRVDEGKGEKRVRAVVTARPRDARRRRRDVSTATWLRRER